MEGIDNPPTRTVEEVFTDFKGRRSGIIKALTTDAYDFYDQCDPREDNLCLYGLPDESWVVNPPMDVLPSELPEPTLGINFPRNGMPSTDWRFLVAVHSDSWLISVASYFGARFGFGKNHRKRLFDMINDLPTVLEVITSYTEQSKIHNANLSRSKSMDAKMSLPIREEDGDDDDERVGSCTACGESHKADQFWIWCETCERWFHGRCVRIAPPKAELLKSYKCLSCANKRPRLGMVIKIA